VRWSRRAPVPAAVAVVVVAVGGVTAAASTSAGCRPSKRYGKTVHVCSASAGRAGPQMDRQIRATRLAPGTQVLAPTTIPFTSGFQPDGGNVRNLITIGPIHIDGLCRKTTSPGTGHGKNGNPTYVAPFLKIGGETESKVIVWTETGSLSFKGQVGPRVNIPPGPPDYGIGDTRPGVAGDPVAGEGDHMFAAASNENSDEIRATDPETDNYANPNVRRLLRYPGFNYGSGPIATSNGHLMIASMLTGFDSLGVYNECFFAGSVQVIS
jgi:hypothetical protein